MSQPFFEFLGQVGLLLVLGIFQLFSLDNKLYFLQFCCFLRIQGYCGLFIGFILNFSYFSCFKGISVNFWVVGVSQPFFEFLGQVGLPLVLGIFQSFSLNNTLYFLQFWCFLRIQGYCGLFLGFKGISAIFLALGVFQPFFGWQGCFGNFLRLCR